MRRWTHVWDNPSERFIRHTLPSGKKVSAYECWRIYQYEHSRAQALAALIRDGWNYFLLWKDAHGYGLQCAIADWVPTGHVSIQ